MIESAQSVDVFNEKFTFHIKIILGRASEDMITMILVNKQLYAFDITIVKYGLQA